LAACLWAVGFVAGCGGAAWRVGHCGRAGDNLPVSLRLQCGDRGLFDGRVVLQRGDAAVTAGPLSGRRYDGKGLEVVGSRVAQCDGGARIVHRLADGSEVAVRVTAGDVAVFEVEGGSRLSRLRLPVRLGAVRRLAMDYGWVMKEPGRFGRDRVMTNFVVAESDTAAVLLGCDWSWRFEVNPAGSVAVVSAHRAADVRFFVAVGPKGRWGELISAYRAAAHGDWQKPLEADERGILEDLARRMVLDDWSRLNFRDVPKLLGMLRFLECERLLVVRHNWQRFGYDVKLPDTWEPNGRFGGLAGMLVLSKYCRDHGLLFGLHENFDDLYPDAPTFAAWRVAYRPREWHAGQRRRYRGWFNRHTGVQALRHTPESALRAMRRNLALEEKWLDVGCCFLDVTSYTDPEPVETPDGRFVGVENVLSLERRIYREAARIAGGAVLGEGCTEKFIGAVHGANCDLWHVDRWSNKARAADWEYFPLLDWLAHDRVVLQGAGYPGRFGRRGQVRIAAELYEPPFTDNYKSARILFGHPPLYFLVHATFSLDPLRIARCYWLGVPFAKVVALKRIIGVSLDGGNIHRQVVRYEDGTTVWVNRSDEPWPVGGHLLGRYGYLVKAAHFEQALEMMDGAEFEIVRAPGVLYLDFRGRRRTCEGVTADGAVLILKRGSVVSIVPLGGNPGPIRVDLPRAAGIAADSIRSAKLVTAAGKCTDLEVRQGVVTVPAQERFRPKGTSDMLKRPLHKAVVTIQGSRGA